MWLWHFSLLKHIDGWWLKSSWKFKVNTHTHVCVPHIKNYNQRCKFKPNCHLYVSFRFFRKSLPITFLVYCCCIFNFLSVLNSHTNSIPEIVFVANYYVIYKLHLCTGGNIIGFMNPVCVGEKGCGIKIIISMRRWYNYVEIMYDHGWQRCIW